MHGCSCLDAAAFVALSMMQGNMELPFIKNIAWLAVVSKETAAAAAPANSVVC
jgi:hypothetical protein